MIENPNIDPKTGQPFPKTRSLVIGLGKAKFASGGKGEISVPVVKMAEAMERAFERERRRSGREVLVVDVSFCSCDSVLSLHLTLACLSRLQIDEHLTTQLCCRCGARTQKPFVWKKGQSEWVAEGGREMMKRSGRLQCCTSSTCTKTLAIDRPVTSQRRDHDTQVRLIDRGERRWDRSLVDHHC